MFHLKKKIINKCEQPSGINESVAANFIFVSEKQKPLTDFIK